MLTRLIRTQLIIFTIASVIGLSVMVFGYMQAPVLLGIGRITVKLEVPVTGGLYKFSNVTYRGVEVGKVTDIEPTRDGAVVTMSLESSPQIPVNLEANVRSVSAIGEQYVDLVPRGDGGPYLEDGSVITAENASLPQPIGPMLDQTSALVDSIPSNRLSDLLDETYKAFNGAGPDLGSLLDSSNQLAADFNAAGDATRRLIDDSAPLMDGQAESVDAIRTWADSLAGITETIDARDSEVRTILSTGAGASDEARSLLEQVKPTLPVLLANLTTVGQVGVTYNASIEQLLVLLPPYLAASQSFGPVNTPTGGTPSAFVLALNDPPPCSVGFLPPSSWRSPADLTDIDTPDGLYCKLPQDSPLAVRGARNYPCMGQPGKRAPTVEICESDRPFEPLAMRQHVLGPYPIDPNLVTQGVPLDERVTEEDQIFGPLEGTPMPPPAPAAPVPGGPAPASVPAGAPLPEGGALPGTPSGHTTGTDSPTVGFATYNPESGQYAGPDGKLYSQSDLVNPAPQSWQDMMPK